MDFNVRDLDGTKRAFAIRSLARDYLHKSDGSLIALTKNCVAAIQAWIRNFGDEELRAVGIRSGVGIGESPGAIELDVRRSLILELVPGIARAVASGISTLNHEFGNHTMEDSAIIERDAVLFGVRDGAGPVFGTVGKSDKVLDSDRRYLRKQRAMKVAGRGVDDGGGF